MINIGIIGSGQMGNFIAQCLNSNVSCGFKLRSVLSRSLHSGRKFASDHDIEYSNVHTDIHQFLNDNSLDAVYIASPTAIKNNYLTLSVEKNKHVLIEKPINYDRKLIEAFDIAISKKLVILEASHCLHNKIFSRLTELINRYVGRIEFVDATFNWPSPDEALTKLNPSLEPNGVLGDLGWYLVRTLVEICGGDFEHSSQLIKNKNGAIVEHSTIGSNVTTSFVLNSSYRQSTVRQVLRISGSKGELIINDFIMPYWGSFVYGDVQRYLDIEVRHGMKPTLDGKFERIYFTGEQHINMLNFFSESIKTPHSFIETMLNKTLTSSKLINDIRKSSIIRHCGG
ncbi:Gfo/Idh/MocA family protein [Vibrio hepatarius]|uniref:Gfo/Idh/MocA family protein n=1 Tax=Vibrio hepatarius TaxID=171383 RepID=UPI001C0A0C7A|nr:Gfo/Idh/MocA family oxidoreductase [Vibrio hepatarius]MBU2896626.1 Gfo/Idh/MocA family oxidoreductase [Vibrio hepatarius]